MANFFTTEAARQDGTMEAGADYFRSVVPSKKSQSGDETPKLPS
jgi:hypothetical protein